LCLVEIEKTAKDSYVDFVEVTELLFCINEIDVMPLLDYCCEGHRYGFVTVEMRRECLYYLDMLICNIMEK